MDEEKRAGPEQQPGAELPAFAGQETCNDCAALAMRYCLFRVMERIAAEYLVEAARWK